MLIYVEKYGLEIASSLLLKLIASMCMNLSYLPV